MMFFVTTIFIKDNDVKRSRCVGYFSDVEAAKKVVYNNYGDIHEAGYYNYCVIERIEEGLYQFDTNPLWYEWSKSKGGFVDCLAPLAAKHTIGFSIG